MKTVNVKNCTFGQGQPKICIPVMGQTLEQLEQALEKLVPGSYDVIEWRMDHLKEVQTQYRQALELVSKAIGDAPLLATFRTAKEGGEMSLSEADYLALNQAVIETGLADMVDVEAFTGDEIVNQLVSFAHEHSVVVVMSNHDFDQTPKDIVSRLQKMNQLGADIVKIAVMPQSKEDVLDLLYATVKANEVIDRPIITMSMGALGLPSRLVGEIFGSCLTFGAAGKVSAPGQMDVLALKQVLSSIHQAQ